MPGITANDAREQTETHGGPADTGPSPGELDARLREVDRGIARVRRMLAQLIVLRSRRWQHERATKQEMEADAPPEESTGPIRAPPADLNRLTAHLTVQELEEELRRVEMELAQLAAEQRRLVQEGIPEIPNPYRKDEYTLYARLRRTRSPRSRVEYVFLHEPKWDTVPAPKPDGYEAVHPVPEEPPRLRPETSNQAPAPA